MLRNRSAFILSAVLLAAALAGPVGAMTLVGTARVVDGDTLDLTGERIRLIGVDAPEIA